MEYVTLGISPLRVSRIGFGCMSLGDADTANIRLLQQAVDLGISYFDTADLYQHGHNEEILGKAFKAKRKNVVLASKAGNQWRNDGSGWDWNPKKEYILSCAEKSLRRLQTDYIDLYQLHGGTIDDPIDETIEAFELLKRQGKILQYGISSIRPHVIREYAKRSGIISVMMQYSLLDRRPEETCLELLSNNNIAVLARGSLAKGLLINKPAEAYLNYSADEVRLAASAIARVSNEKRGLTQTAIRFVLKRKAVAAAVVGIRTTEQLEEAVKAVDAPELRENETRLLEECLPANRYEQYR